MTSPALTTRRGGVTIAHWPEVPLGVAAIAAAGVFLAVTAMTGGVPNATTFFDSDDATRMVQVREFLNGAAWYDTTLDRFGGAHPLLSHWSRLVDLPVALLISLFRWIMPAGAAEVAARTVWPISLFAGLLFMMARAAAERAGPTAGYAALVLGVLCLSGTMQFAPGRIDHHNVMILSAVTGGLLLAHSFVKPKWGWGAGAFLGFGVAVGYEALLLTGLTLTVAALFAVLTGNGRSGVRRAALSFASTLSILFLVTTNPERWRDASCDNLSINLILMTTAGSIGLAGVLHMRTRRSIEVRIAALAATGITALAMYTVVGPQCLKGPFAGLDPRVWPIWLDQVMETHGILWLAQSLPMVAGVYLVHILIGVAASIAVFRQDRDWSTFFFATVMVIWALASLWQAKLMPYAAFLAVVPMAVALARLERLGTLSAGMTRIGGLAVGNQFALLALAALVFGVPDAKNRTPVSSMGVRRACLTGESLKPLAHFSRALVAAPADLGPFIVANTQLDVLAAPYHRLDRQIVEVYDLLAAGEDEAKRRIERAGISYVVLCGDTREIAPPAREPGSLEGLLRAGTPPDYLEPVTLTGATPLQMWRFK